MGPWLGPGPELNLPGVQMRKQVLLSHSGVTANHPLLQLCPHCGKTRATLRRCWAPWRTLAQSPRRGHVFSTRGGGNAGREGAVRAARPSLSPHVPSLTLGPSGSFSGRSPRWPSSRTRACPTSKCFASSWRAAFWTSRTTAPTCCTYAWAPDALPQIPLLDDPSWVTRDGWF